MGRKRRPEEAEAPNNSPSVRRLPSSSSNPNSNPNPPPGTLIPQSNPIPPPQALIFQNPPISTPDPRPQRPLAFSAPAIAHQAPPIVPSKRQQQARQQFPIPQQQQQPPIVQQHVKQCPIPQQCPIVQQHVKQARQQCPIPQQQQQQPPIVQQHVKLFRADGSSADGCTLFKDLHLESQRLMLQVHGRIQQYKGESELIDQYSRLSDTPRDYFGLEAARICQELRGFSSIAARQTIEVRKLMPVVQDLMSIVEVAVNSFWRSKQMLLGNVSTSYMALPVRLAPFLQKTVQRFEDELKECCDWIDKHKWLSYLNACRPHPSSSSLQVIEETLSNNYALILHLAGKVEKLHQTMEPIKKSFLLNHHWWGQESTPFLEADRREAARQEAAATRVHPTIHLSSIGIQAFTLAGPSSTMLQQSVGSSVFSSDGWHQAFSTPSPSVYAPGLPNFPAGNPTPVMNFAPPSTSQFGSAANPTIYAAPSTTPFTSGAAGGSGSNQSPTRSSSKHKHNPRNRR